MKLSSHILLLSSLGAASCGPVAWNHYAEYLPAPRKTVQQVSSASIRELVAELPPSKVYEPDAASLARSVDAAEVFVEGGAERLILPATAAAPERRFFANRWPGSTLLKMEVKPPGKATETHVFQRQSSYWDYSIQPPS